MKNPRAEQPNLTLRPEAPALRPVVTASSWEYEVGGEPWRVWRPAELAAEFNVVQAELSGWHTAVATVPRAWLIARRLFGVVPVLPGPETQPDDLRVWGMPELTAALGLTRAQMQAELATARGHWEGRRAAVAPPPPPPVVTAVAAEELPLTDPVQVLERWGFPQLKFESVEETTRFLRRVEMFEPLLRETMAGGLARELLLQELRMSRLDQQLDAPGTRGAKDWRDLLKLRGELGDRYEALAKLLFEKCPWAAQVAGKVALKGNVSEITEGIRAYKARGCTQLLDGVHTALEILVQCRQSVQAPEPGYRAGVVVYLNAARAGLWDPHWTSPFKPGELRRMTQCWSETYKEGARSDGDPLPDLVAGGEYPPLPVTTPSPNP